MQKKAMNFVYKTDNILLKMFVVSLKVKDDSTLIRHKFVSLNIEKS